MLLSEYIVDIEKPDEICALTFVVNEFLGIFFYHSIFLLNTQDLHK